MADKKGVWNLYDNGKAKNRNCPKCGPGHFLANHKGRVVCGKCGYVEYNKQEKSE
jgi:small subunit ribosomal protein S27Ae